MLVRDEGNVPYPYDDATSFRLRAPKGNVTIGIGHNLDAKPLPPEVVDLLFLHDLADAVRDARDVLGEACWAALTENRRLAILNLAFGMGRKRLSGFRQMLAAVRAEDWPKAGEELRNSLWSTQVDPRRVPNQGRDDRVIALLQGDRYDY